jgi:hypothetical protein
MFSFLTKFSIDTDYFKQADHAYYAHPDTKYCLFEAMLTTLRNIEVNKKAVFGSDLEGEGESLIDTFFLGETNDDFNEQFCRYSVPIKMSDLIHQIQQSDGETSIADIFVKHRAEAGKPEPIFKSLKQRFLILKLDYTDVSLDLKELKNIWKGIHDRIDTDLFTKHADEEDKVDGENARLVAIVDRLNGEATVNNNEVSMLIDNNWRNFKTCIYKTNSYDHIIEDAWTAKRLPIILVYKLIENVPVNDPMVHRKSKQGEKQIIAPPVSHDDSDISDYRKSQNVPPKMSNEGQGKFIVDYIM